jgi:hypothetical protein
MVRRALLWFTLLISAFAGCGAEGDADLGASGDGPRGGAADAGAAGTDLSMIISLTLDMEGCDPIGTPDLFQFFLLEARESDAGVATYCYLEKGEPVSEPGQATIADFDPGELDEIIVGVKIYVTHVSEECPDCTGAVAVDPTRGGAYTIELTTTWFPMMGTGCIVNHPIMSRTIPSCEG